MPNSTRRLIVALDPGTEWLGYCVLRPGARTAEKIGAVHLKGRLFFRIGWLYDEVEKLLAAYSREPIDCVVEKAIVWGGNLATIALAEARGAILAAIVRAKGKARPRIYEYHASSVKKGVAGRGNASKQELAVMVRRLLSIDDSTDLQLDATDAGGLALLHAFRGPAWGSEKADQVTTETQEG